MAERNSKYQGKVKHSGFVQKLQFNPGVQRAQFHEKQKALPGNK